MPRLSPTSDDGDIAFIDNFGGGVIVCGKHVQFSRRFASFRRISLMVTRLTGVANIEPPLGKEILSMALFLAVT